MWNIVEAKRGLVAASWCVNWEELTFLSKGRACNAAATEKRGKHNRFTHVIWVDNVGLSLLLEREGTGEEEDWQKKR